MKRIKLDCALVNKAIADMDRAFGADLAMRLGGASTKSISTGFRKPKEKKMKAKTKKPVHVDRLRKALAAWVEKEGGSLLVAGRIEVQRFPTGMKCYRIGIHCTGNPPPEK